MELTQASITGEVVLQPANCKVESKTVASPFVSVDIPWNHPSTTLVWRNLLVRTREGQQSRFFRRLRHRSGSPPTSKILLHNLNGVIDGGLWAVLGPSGSGKSTLLNTLACRLDISTVAEGEMHLNGATYSNAELKRIAGYVMQDDLLNGQLTIEETLMYTAELRLPRAFTDEQRRARVEVIIAELGLGSVRDRVIGSQAKQGVSGSERKRLCVGMQLISRPRLLFLDEPTTGLDAVTAYDLLVTLYGLAREQTMTIVCSIHQPQAKIFNLFDSVILLRAGRTVYQGPRDQVMKSFERAGFPCPLYTNPADHLLDVITPTGETGSETTVFTLDSSPHIDGGLGVDQECHPPHSTSLNPTWNKQVRILLRRNLQQLRRYSQVFVVSLIQSIIMAVLVGVAFFRIDNSQKSVFRRESILFSCVVNQGLFGALMILNSFPVERTLTLRERASGTYQASAYFIAKILVDTFVQLPVPVFFSCIVYFLVGFQATIAKFLIFTLLIILCSITSTSMALMISTLCKTTSLSITIVPMVLEVSRLFGGFLLAPSRIPTYFVWLDVFSYFKYAYVGLSLNELGGLQFQCDGVANGTSCEINNGEALIHERGFDYISISGCMAVLVAFIVVVRTIAFVGVRFRKH